MIICCDWNFFSEFATFSLDLKIEKHLSLSLPVKMITSVKSFTAGISILWFIVLAIQRYLTPQSGKFAS